MPYPYGVTGFTLWLLGELKQRGIPCGLLLYRRTSGISAPHVQLSEVRGLPAVRLAFDFGNSTTQLKSAIGRSIRILASHYSKSDPIVYHQTPTFVPFTPSCVRFLVTHHGPFAHEIIRIFGREFAIEAFGSEAKLEHLVRTQEKGISFLARRNDAVALEMSQVQMHALLGKGVPANRVRVCAPVLRVPLRDEVGETGFDSGRSPRVISAAARIDEFKQFSILIEAVNLLRRNGLHVGFSLYAGNRAAAGRRAGLAQNLDPVVRRTAFFGESLPHEKLMKLFAFSRSNGIFVSTSCYETFGITPLEAILSGVVTIVPDLSDSFGLVNLVPRSFRYDNSVAGLSNKIAQIASSGHLRDIGVAQMLNIRARLDQENFVQVFMKIAAGSNADFQPPNRKAV